MQSHPPKLVAAPGVAPGNVLAYETELVLTSPQQNLVRARRVARRFSGNRPDFLLLEEARMEPGRRLELRYLRYRRSASGAPCREKMGRRPSAKRIPSRRTLRATCADF